MDYGFVWDEQKYEVVQRTHDVSFSEVVSVFEDLSAFELPDPQGSGDRYMLVGRAATDRILSVIFALSEADAPLYRLITAFDAPEGYLSEYYRQ